MFGLFGSKKKNESVADLLAGFLIYQQLVGQIGKARSLTTLNRIDEAQTVLIEAERMADNYLSQNPHEKKAHMMLALFYSEVDVFEKAEPIIDRLLSSGEFQLNDEERLILSAEFQRIQRQRPANQRPADGPKGFTQIYCCASCGRLHNFVTMPCPQCDGSPQTVEEMARAIVLSSSHLKVPDLLLLAREMAKGRAASDVMPNLMTVGKTLLSTPKHKQAVEELFSELLQDKHKNHHRLNMARECSGCRKRILFSGDEECESCEVPVNWPDALRALVCMDNLLWLLERRIEVSSTEAFSDFVCVLVVMTNNLLRSQEVPSSRDRQYCLQLLAEMGVVCDLNKGAVIDTKNPKQLEIHLMNDRMREDSESYGIFLFKELEFFVTKMVDGVRK